MLFALGEWVESASCRQEGAQPDIWFEDANQARTICSRCPVNDDCLDTAITIHNNGIRVEGIWAGLSAIQIKRLVENPERSSVQKMRQVRRKPRPPLVVLIPEPRLP